jgi:tetratricopeptide (TPR) repeat protein
MKRSWGRGHFGAIALALTIAAALALLLMKTPPFGKVSRLEHQQQMKDAEIRERFRQATVMLHARQYEHAATALHRVLALSPRMPEAHVNMGFALLGLQRAKEARAFFLGAIDLNPRQANAYYGLAVADESVGNYESALGGMRTFLHLSKADDPYRDKARAAIWEWEARLGRHKPLPETGKG